MSRPILSIIIPVYNGEFTIERCLNSILAIDGDYEIIVINDGSTDNTINLLKQYCKSSKVHIINQINQGVSAARNCGLLYARGEYITFVDCDDYVCENFIPEILNDINSQHSDLYIYKYKNIDKDSTHSDIDTSLSPTTEQIISNTFFPVDSRFTKFSLRTVWGKVIKKHILDSHEIQFPVNISFGEDMLFMLYVYTYSSSIEFKNQYLYYYFFSNELSATNKYKPDIDATTFKQKQSIDIWLKKCNQSYEVYKKYILCYSLNDLILFLKFSLFHRDNKASTANKKQKFLLYLSNNNYNYSYNYCRKTRIVYKCKIQQRIIYWLAYHHCFSILSFVFKFRYSI